MFREATAPAPVLSTERHEQFGTDWVNGQPVTVPVGVDEVHWAECPEHGTRVHWHSVAPLSTLDFCRSCGHEAQRRARRAHRADRDPYAQRELDFDRRNPHDAGSGAT